MSPSAKMPKSSTMRRRISDSTMRLRLGVEALVAAGILDRLEVDAAHALVGERMAHDGADLVVVDAALDRADQRRRDVARLEVGQRLAADARQRGAAQVLQRRVVQRIELQVDLEARPELGQRIDEGGILGDADAVGVQHHVLDRPAPRRGDDLEDLRMDGGLAARDLHQVGLAFARHQGVEHALDLGQAAMGVPLGRGIGEADRTGEVAGLVDLDDGQAGMLLVVGAEAAVPRTAALGAGVRRQGAVAGLQVFQRAPPVDRIVRHQGLHHAVLGTALGVVDAAVLLDDLGRHQAEAGLAQRGGLAEEEIGRGLTRYAIVHRGPRCGS